MMKFYKLIGTMVFKSLTINYDKALVVKSLPYNLVNEKYLLKNHAVFVIAIGLALLS